MWQSLSTRGAGENGRMCCEGSRHRRAPMRSRRCSDPGRPLGDTKVSGRRVTCKATLAHLEGGSGRSEVSPTAILQDTHSLEVEFCELLLYGVLGNSLALGGHVLRFHKEDEQDRPHPDAHQASHERRGVASSEAIERC